MEQVKQDVQQGPVNEDIDLEYLREYIRNTSESSAVYIGCDSKKFVRRGRRKVAFVTVVVVHLNQNNGARVFKKVEIIDDWGMQLRQRLMQEVYSASAMALELVDVIGNRPFQVHLDINPDPRHKSNVVVKEAVGFIMGTLGFEPVLKPHSLASSSAADAITVKIADVRKRDRKAPIGERQRRPKRGK